MVTFLGPALTALAFVAMLAWTWNGWPDPIVDFGRELYVPWQLSQGRVLYREIAYFNGPLSPYFNALLFKLLGVSLRTLVLANIAICVGVIVMIWKLFRLAGGRVSATVACLLFVTLFMTTQFVAIGNYNWITPYSHELTHGIALSLAAILAIVARRTTIAGLLVGLVYLTKPEVFLAIAPAIALGVIFARGRSARSVLAFIVAACVPVMISAALLGVRGTLGGWMYVFDSGLGELAFYRRSAGTDDASGNAIVSLMQLGLVAFALAPAVAIDLMLRRERATRRVRIIIATTYAAALLLILWKSDIGWHDAFRWMPFAIAAAFFTFAFTQRWRPRVMLRLMLMAFAALLTLKLILAVRLYHYGFALAMPALLVCAALLICWIPRSLHLRPPATIQFSAIASLGLIVFVYLRAYGQIYSHKPIVVALETADEFRSDATGQIADDLVDILKPLPGSTTVAVVPQGVMINYLSGKSNPTPYFTLMPPEVLMFGDERIAAAYERHPPDVLVVIATDLGEYGYRSFDEVAPRTSAWFRANYQPMQTINRPGLPPVTILRRGDSRQP